MRKLAAGLLALALTGCVSSGTKITGAEIAQLRPGQTTYRDAVALLGQPTAEARGYGGGHAVSYSFASGHANAASYIPVVGLFAGGAHGESQSVTLRFDRNDVLLGVSIAESHVDTGI